MDAGGRGSPLARARDFAAARVRAGGQGDRYAVVAAGAAPVRLAGPVAPGPEIDAALASAPHRAGGRRPCPSAIDLAAARWSPAPRARAWSCSATAESTPAPRWSAACPSRQRAFPPRAHENLGIAPLSTTRPAPDAREGEREAEVVVATSSATPRAAPRSRPTGRRSPAAAWRCRPSGEAEGPDPRRGRRLAAHGPGGAGRRPARRAGGPTTRPPSPPPRAPCPACSS